MNRLRDRPLAWPLASAFAAFTACAALGAVASTAGANGVAPLPAAGIEAVARRGQAQVAAAHSASPALQFEVHRRQAFTADVAGRRLTVLSMAWWPRAGGDGHCGLVVDDGAHASVTDALAAEGDEMPWACDGEAALRFADVTGDGCADVVALYPYRPPSGEHFPQPLVLRCAGGGWVLDAERTRWLGAPAQRAAGIATLSAAVRLLAKYPSRDRPQ